MENAMFQQNHGMRVLVVNCDSSSIKHQLYRMPDGPLTFSAIGLRNTWGCMRRYSRERLFSTRKSRTKVLVIPTDEEAAVAADTYKISSKIGCPTP